MSDSKTYAVPNSITPSKCITFNETICNGCNICIQHCQMDVFHPNPIKGKPPIVLYPDECWYCGCCVLECPKDGQGAIKLNFPLMLKVRWKDKETGEHFRIGMANSLPANTRPPIGGWRPHSKKIKK
jgi:NAD-dependent dihydropyrimidine dehydrogenase PreA subunit